MYNINVRVSPPFGDPNISYYGQEIVQKFLWKKDINNLMFPSVNADNCLQFSKYKPPVKSLALSDIGEWWNPQDVLVNKS